MVRGVKIYYEAVGKGESPVVLISGTGFHSGVWRPFQVPYLSRHYTVVLSDHRGVGLSDKPDEEYSTRLFASDIIGVLDHLGIEKAHFLGHSMGGRVAQWIALDFPKRVSTLILASSGSGNFSKVESYPRGIPLQVAADLAEKGYKRFLRDHVTSEFFFTRGFLNGKSERLRISVRAHLSNPPPLKAYLRHVIARQMHETTGRLGEITAPTLVMVGELDTHRGGTGSHFDAAKALAQGIKGSSFATVPNSKHAVFWERPQESNEIVSRFLTANQ